jgi:hypothetical protein
VIFNPRQARWAEHFEWNGLHLLAITPLGEAMIEMLDLNCERRIRVRRMESRFGIHPPPAGS